MNESRANLNVYWSDKHISNIPAVSRKAWPQNNENLENCEFNLETRMDLTCHLYKHTDKGEKSTLGYNEITIPKFFFSSWISYK
jgi:hypothetical protein